MLSSEASGFSGITLSVLGVCGFGLRFRDRGNKSVLVTSMPKIGALQLSYDLLTRTLNPKPLDP